MALETKIAQSHASRSESGDIQKGNNVWERADFKTKAPGLDWTAYFAAAGLDKQTTFIRLAARSGQRLRRARREREHRTLEGLSHLQCHRSLLGPPAESILGRTLRFLRND